MAKKKESNEDKLVNIQAAQLAAQVANQAAQLEFQKERMRLLELPQFAHLSQMAIDELAFKKSSDAWQRAMQEAATTGTFNGVPTIEWLTQQARLTGVLNGQQTLEGAMSAAQIAQMNHNMVMQQKQQDLEVQKFGFQREQWDFDSQMRLEAQQAELTGMINGEKTFAREQFEADKGMEYLNLVSSLRGASNAFAQLDVMNAAQGMGMSGFADQITGRTQAAGAAAVGGPPPAANAQNFYQPYIPQTGAPAPGMPGAPGMPAENLDPSMLGRVPGQKVGLPPGVDPQGQPGGVQFMTEGAMQRAMPAGGMPGSGMEQVPPELSAQIAAMKGQAPAGGVPGSMTPEGMVQYGPQGANPNVYATGGSTRFNEQTGQYEYVAGPAAAMQPQAGIAPYQPPAYIPPPQVAAIGAEAPQGYAMSPPGVQAPVGSYNYETTPGGQTNVYPPGAQAPTYRPQVSSSTPQPLTQAQQLAHQVTGGVAPNKINAENYKNAGQFKNELMWAGFEALGNDKTAAQDQFKASLPKYGGPKRAGVVGVI